MIKISLQEARKQVRWNMKIIPKNEYQIGDRVYVTYGHISEHYTGHVIGINLHRNSAKLDYTILDEENGMRMDGYEEKDFYKTDI